MIHRSELINYLIQKHGLKSYLEIGVYDRSHNFDMITCESKHCVDPDPKAKASSPMTSDKFFARNKDRFDIVFIDGLHHHDQVERDFDNALAAGAKFIVLHDCNPPTKETTCVPRGRQREWCGDVYKFIMTIHCYEAIDFVTVDMDYGCCVAWRSGRLPAEQLPFPLTWEAFDKNRKEAINLVSVEELLEYGVGHKPPFDQDEFKKSLETPLSELKGE